MATAQCPYKPATEMRAGLEPVPRMMQDLPLDDRGYPVPFFVDWYADGAPEFRAMDPRKLVRCVKEKLCWVCGNKLYSELVFVIGPMCAINRVNSEPPAHRECALYSARNCPFLSRPHMVRNTSGLPEDVIGNAAGVPILRNPGAMCLWFCRRYKIIQVQADDRGAKPGILFELGTPQRVQWYAEGRPATRAEVLESIETGLPLLYEANDREHTQAERDTGRRMIDQRFAELKRLLPKT